jgi:hypothetical protein
VSTAINPYAAPQAAVEDFSASPEADAIRRAHISHEASIKGVGLLYYITGAGMLVGGAVGLLGASFGRNATFMLVVFVGLGLLSVGFLAVGRVLRTLNPWARVPTTVLAGLGLLGFPVGTLINGYILWLIYSQRGRVILAPEYAAIVEATPDVKYRTPLWIWILLGVLVLALAAVLIPTMLR